MEADRNGRAEESVAPMAGGSIPGRSPRPRAPPLYSSAYHRYRDVYYVLKPVFEKVET